MQSHTTPAPRRSRRQGRHGEEYESSGGAEKRGGGYAEIPMGIPEEPEPEHAQGAARVESKEGRRTGEKRSMIRRSTS